MAPGKIVDEGEVLRWFEEGRTYKWMAEEYLRKYNIEIGISGFSQFRRRKGLSRRIPRNDQLIPWKVKQEHRFAYPLMMLRVEARKRDGYKLRESDKDRLASYLSMLEREGAVIHYEPDTEQGFFLVPRQPGDHDLIHEPKRKTTVRPHATD